MEKFILSDSGREKRYKQALSLHDSLVNNIVNIAKDTNRK